MKKKKIVSDIMAFTAMMLAGWAVLETAFFEHQLAALVCALVAALVWFWAASIEEEVMQEEWEEQERREQEKRSRDLRELLYWDDGEDYEAM